MSPKRAAPLITNNRATAAKVPFADGQPVNTAVLVSPLLLVDCTARR